ncbi:hypothetical protein Tco_1493869, partial [Tanacetum coccineum]
SDMAEFNTPKWQLPLMFEMKDKCSEKSLVYDSCISKQRVDMVEEFFEEVRLNSWNEEPCSDVHQVGDEREVEVLCNFNRPPRELITEDGVLPERGYSQFNDVSSGYLFSMGHAHGLCSLARAVQFSTGRAVGMIVQFSTDRAVGTIVQFGTSLSSLAQNLIISLWLKLCYGVTINDEKNVFANERQHSEKHDAECVDERDALANLIANLTLDTEENKTILKQLKKANASKTQELEKCKTNREETIVLGGALSLCGDKACLIALQNKQNELNPEKPVGMRIPFDRLLNPAQTDFGHLKGKDQVDSDNKSRSKLDKDTVKPYDYTRQNKKAKKSAQTSEDKEVNGKLVAPTGSNTQDCLSRWVPQERHFASYTTKLKSEPPNGSKADIPKPMRKLTSSESQCRPRLHQMTSDHNRSELGIQDHSNEPSSSKLVLKVVPLAVKTATSRQELELLFHHHIAMPRTTGSQAVIKSPDAISIMSMLVKDIRSQDGKDDKDNDKGSKSRSQSMKEQAYNEDKDQEHSSLNDKSNLTDLMKECHQ